MSDSQVSSIDSAPATPTQTKATSTRISGKQSGHDAALSGKRQKIEIFASEQEHGDNAVEVGLNGVMYLIPRGEVVDPPVEVVEVLNNAVMTVTTPVANGGGVNERRVPRYNFRQIG